MPVSLLKTLSTSVVLGSIEIMKSLLAIALKLLTAIIFSLSSFFVTFMFQSKTLTSNSALIIFLIIGRPILPAPMKPTDIFLLFIFVLNFIIYFFDKLHLNKCTYKCILSQADKNIKIQYAFFPRNQHF